MTALENQTKGARPSFSQALDWSAGRTWAVFLGSAIACGSVIAAGVLAVQVVYLGLPSAPLTRSDLVIGTVLAVLVVVTAFTFLHHFLVRGRRNGGEDAPKEAASDDLPQISAWNDFWFHLLWFAVLGLPYLAVHFSFFGAPHVAGLMFALPYGAAAGFSRLLLPTFMQRWAQRSHP